jgi:tetratricopeptide (TPR) repeat protein
MKAKTDTIKLPKNELIALQRRILFDLFETDKATGKKVYDNIVTTVESPDNFSRSQLIEDGPKYYKLLKAVAIAQITLSVIALITIVIMAIFSVWWILIIGIVWGILAYTINFFQTKVNVEIGSRIILFNELMAKDTAFAEKVAYELFESNRDPSKIFEESKKDILKRKTAEIDKDSIFFPYPLLAIYFDNMEEVRRAYTQGCIALAKNSANIAIKKFSLENIVQDDNLFINLYKSKQIRIMVSDGKELGRETEESYLKYIANPDMLKLDTSQINNKSEADFNEWGNTLKKAIAKEIEFIKNRYGSELSNIKINGNKTEKRDTKEQYSHEDIYEKGDGVHQDYKEAVKCYRKAAEKGNAEAYYNLGHTYGSLGRWQDAIEALKRAIRIKPDYAEAHRFLGFAYGFYLGRYQDAIESHKQAIRIKPDFAMAHYNLGVAYAKLGRWQDMVEAYKQIIRIKPDLAEAHNSLGFAYGKLGRYQDAIEFCKQAIRLKPDYAEAYLGLGITYFITGDKGSALEEYKILKTLDAELANELFNMIYK